MNYTNFLPIPQLERSTLSISTLDYEYYYEESTTYSDLLFHTPKLNRRNTIDNDISVLLPIPELKRTTREKYIDEVCHGLARLDSDYEDDIIVIFEYDDMNIY